MSGLNTLKEIRSADMHKAFFSFCQI